MILDLLILLYFCECNSLKSKHKTDAKIPTKILSYATHASVPLLLGLQPWLQWGQNESVRL